MIKIKLKYIISFIKTNLSKRNGNQNNLYNIFYSENFKFLTSLKCFFPFEKQTC